MQKVITINLNGTAYQLDEDAYDALRRYLDGARLRLKDNPDLAEIMADLEQAIGEKCQKFLNPHKSVVSAAEIARVIDEMGPVDVEAPTEGEGGTSGAPPHDGDAPKRLYQIREGAMLSGVCQGLAAYLHVDVTLIRIIFVVLAVVSKGGFALVYLVLMFVIPPASTSEEHAAAFGAPFNAKEIVDQAKHTAREVVDQARQSSAAFTSTDWRRRKDWRRQWRQEKQQWRRNWFRERREWKRQWRQSRAAWWGAAPPIGSTGYATRVTAGFLAPVLGLVSAAVFWLWAAALMSLLGTGAIFGRPLPSDLPLWAGFLILVLLYNMILWPLQYARHASHQVLGSGDRGGPIAAWDGMMGFGFWILLGWVAYTYIPEVHQFLNNLPAIGDNLRQIFQPR